MFCSRYVLLRRGTRRDRLELEGPEGPEDLAPGHRRALQAQCRARDFAGCLSLSGMFCSLSGASSPLCHIPHSVPLLFPVSGSPAGAGDLLCIQHSPRRVSLTGMMYPHSCKAEIHTGTGVSAEFVRLVGRSLCWKSQHSAAASGPKASLASTSEMSRANVLHHFSGESCMLFCSLLRLLLAGDMKRSSQLKLCCLLAYNNLCLQSFSLSHSSTQPPPLLV